MAALRDMHYAEHASYLRLESWRETLAESNAQWARYRDSECDRQLAAVAGRNHPDVGELTCRLRQTRHRVADPRFDETPTS